MPTIFTHAVIGSAAAKVFQNDPVNRPALIACALLSLLPDVDGLFFGIIPYAHVLGHRGFTHSLLFATLIGVLTAWIFVWRKLISQPELGLYAVLFASVMASHGVLDAFTSGSLGVAFFAPFHVSRYVFPYRPIPVSPMSAAALLSARGWRVISAELWMLWTFAAAA